MTEIIKVMWAKELPFDTQKELGFPKGLVEIQITKNSPWKLEKITPLEGTFSELLIKTLSEDGFLNEGMWGTDHLGNTQ